MTTTVYLVRHAESTQYRGIRALEKIILENNSYWDSWRFN